MLTWTEHDVYVVRSQSSPAHMNRKLETFVATPNHTVMSRLDGGFFKSCNRGTYVEWRGFWIGSLGVGSTETVSAMAGLN